jgi:hypothetical protein
LLPAVATGQRQFASLLLSKPLRPAVNRQREKLAKGAKPRPAPQTAGAQARIAENQITKILPKMAQAANAPELKKAFEQHLSQTEGQIGRLERIFEKLETSPGGKKCKGVAGLIAGGDELMKEDADPPAFTVISFHGREDARGDACRSRMTSWAAS